MRRSKLSADQEVSNLGYEAGSEFQSSQKVGWSYAVCSKAVQAKFRQGLANLPPESKKALQEWVNMLLGCNLSSCHPKWSRFKGFKAKSDKGHTSTDDTLSSHPDRLRLKTSVSWMHTGKEISKHEKHLGPSLLNQTQPDPQIWTTNRDKNDKERWQLTENLNMTRNNKKQQLKHNCITTNIWCALMKNGSGIPTGPKYAKTSNAYYHMTKQPIYLDPSIKHARWNGQSECRWNGQPKRWIRFF